MAGKKRQGGNSGGKGGQPNWTPYLIAVGVVFVALGAYSFVFPSPDAEEQQTKKNPVDPGMTSDVLDAQLRKLHAGLSATSGRGETATFQMIRGMADKAAEVLAEADAAPTEDARREILQAGLASKSELLSALVGHSNQLKEDDANEQKKHAPLTMDESSTVVKLTKDTFTNYVAQNSRSMIEFYAPWCGHCKKLAPDFERLAQQFKGRAGFGAVDATVEEQLARIFNVNRFPTLKWFVNGRPIDYDGPPSAEKIEKFVEERLKPAFEEIESIDDMQTAVEQAGGDETSIFAGSGPKDTKLHIAFQAAAENFRGRALFIWAPGAGGAEASAQLYRQGKSPEPCGGAHGNCEKTDEVIEWLENLLPIA